MQRLRHQRMRRHFALAGQVFCARDLVGKHRGEQVFGLHALQLRRHLAAAAEARQGQRGRRVPAPSHVEQRRIEQRLHQHVDRGRGVQVARHFQQRKTVAGRQRQHDRVFGRGRLQLEIEGAAKALAQRQAPSPIQPASVGRMDDQLHAARRIEEALDHDAALRRQRAERGNGAAEVIDDLARGIVGQRHRIDQPSHRSLAPVGGQMRFDFFTQPRHAERQLVSAARCFAKPERNVGCGTLRVFDPHATRLDLENAIAGVAQLKDIARQALDREVFVHRADLVGLRLQHHRVVAGLGNGAARHQRRHARALALAQLVMHRISVHVAGARAMPCGEAFGQHAHDRIELCAGQRGIRPGAPHQCEQLVLVPLAASRLGDDLLRQHVERRGQHVQCIELAAAHAIEQRGALDQLVARLRKEPRLRDAADRVTGSAGALQQRRDGTRRAELAHQVDIADVEPEFERRGSDQHFQLAMLQSLLGIEPRLLRQTPMVRRHRFLAETLAEVPRGALGHAARVDENQRGAVQLHQLRHARVDLFPLLVRHHRSQRRLRQFERQVALLRIADIDDLALRRAVYHGTGADQKTRHFVDRLLRGRQADARQPPIAGERLQTLQRQRQMAAALARCQRMDLVDDHGAHRAEHLAARHRSEQHVQRLGRRHQDVRRLAQRLLPFAGRCVAGAHGGADMHVGQTERRQFGADAGERRFEVEPDVVRQCLQRRDVDHGGLVGQSFGRQTLPHQRIERGEKGGQRFARAGRRGDQRVAARADRRPRCHLSLGRPGEGASEPAGDGGVEVVKWHEKPIKSGRTRRSQVGVTGRSKAIVRGE